jgi:hypothetical protein
MMLSNGVKNMLDLKTLPLTISSPVGIGHLSLTVPSMPLTLHYDGQNNSSIMRSYTRTIATEYHEYWYCTIDTGRLCEDPRNGQLFYQNYDDNFYVERANWCMGKFGRNSRVSYNQFYFQTKEEYNQFEEKWL